MRSNQWKNAGKFSFPECRNEKFKIVFLLFAFFATFSSRTNAATYTWNGATSDFQLQTNWTPSRSVPNASDVLIFQNSTQTVTNIPTQTVATITLQVAGGPANITFQPAAANTLTASAVVSVGAGCTLDLSNGMTVAISGTATNAGTINVNGGALLDFNGVNPVDPGNIQVNAIGELKFSGSGSLTLNAPAISDGTLTIAGTLSAATGTAPVYTSGILQYKGTAAQTTGVEWPTAGANLPLGVIISNAAGVTNSSARALFNSSAASLTLTTGVFNSAAGLLTMPQGSTIIRTAGSLSAAPTFTASVNVTYTGNSSPVTTGPEIPVAPTVLQDLVILKSSSVNQVLLGSAATVNGTVNGLKITMGVLGLNGNILTVTGVASGVSGVGRILVTATSTLSFTGNLPGSIGTLYFVGASLGTLNMNRTGANAYVTFGSLLTVATTLSLSAGIINVVDGFPLSYIGTPANLSAGSNTSYVSFLNSSTSVYGFILGNGAAVMSAATYTLPLGTATTTGFPAVTGYRPVKLTISASSSVYFKTGFVNDAGSSASPGNASDVPLTANNRTGYIVSIFTNIPTYDLWLSYGNTDFNAAVPAIANVNMYSWSGGLWTGSGQSANVAGSPNFIKQNAMALSTGTLVLGEVGGADLHTNPFVWTGAVSTVWENPLNWNGGVNGFYPGQAGVDDVANIPNIVVNKPVLTTSVTVNSVNIGNGMNLTLTPTGYLTLYALNNPLTLTGTATVFANVTSTIEYANGTYVGGWCIFGTCIHTNITTGFTYGNLVLSNRADPTQNWVEKDVNANLNVANSLTVWGGVNMRITAGTTTVNGNVLLTTNLYGTYYGATVTNSSTTPLVMTGTYGSPTLNGTGIVYGGGIGYLRVTGNISVTGSTNVTNLVNTAGIVISINNNDTLRINGNDGFSNSGMIQSSTVDGGTIKFDSQYMRFPVGGGVGGTFNNAAGFRVNVIAAGWGGDSADADVHVNNLTIPSNDRLTIMSAKTLTEWGAFYNNGLLSGPGTIQFLSSVNIPKGTAPIGYFSSTMGSLVNLMVGDGLSSNTVTSTAMDSVFDLTVHRGATLAINSGITLPAFNNLKCNGTIMNGTGNATLSLFGTGTTIDGGIPATHGQINISTFNVFTSGGQTKTVLALAYLDFSAGTTIAYVTGGGQILTNNGSLWINGPMTYLSGVYGGQTFTNTTTGNVTIATLNITGNSSSFSNSGILNSSAMINVSNQWPATPYGFVNTGSGTVNCSAITLASTGGTFDNSGIVHCTGPLGIVGTNGGFYSQWKNNAGAHLDVFGPMLETGGFLTCATSGASNIVIYDGTGTQTVFAITPAVASFYGLPQTSYYHLTIDSARAGANNVILPPRNFNVVGDFIARSTFSTGGYITTGDTMSFVSNAAGNGQGSIVQNITTVPPFAFNNLFINNSNPVNNNVNILTDITVTGLLNFTRGNINAVANNKTVIISPTGTVAGAASNRGWVNGKQQMPLAAGNPFTTFTIGDSLIYAPINLVMNGVAAPSSITSYTLPVNSPFDPSPYPSSIDQLHHVLRYWRMMNNGFAFTSYDATFNFANPSDIVGNPGTDPLLYEVKKFDPFTWYPTSLGLRNLSLTQATGMTTFGTVADPYSDFEIGEVISPLPITLLAFSAEAESKDVLLKWTTESEINNDFFTIEKTTNPASGEFISVGNVDGAGNSTSILHYALKDVSPFNGISYYRLKQTDFDGRYAYSELVPVDFRDKTGTITVFPNPSSGKIYLSVAQHDKEIFMLQIFDMKAKEVMSPVAVSFDRGNLITVNVDFLAAGIYSLRLVSDNIILQSKLVKE